MSESIDIVTIWKGWFGKGKVGYDQLTALKELINNVIQDKKLVNAQVVIDTETKMMWVTDDMCGVETDLLPGVFVGGLSIPNDTLLSEHGDGLTIATNWWGDRKSYSLQHCRVSIDGNDFDEVKLDRSKPNASLKPRYNVEPIQKYSVDNEEWVDTDTPGFQLKIKLGAPPTYVTWFDNLVAGLEASYWKYTKEHLDLEIIWLKKNKFHKHFKIKPVDILRTKTSGENLKKFGTIDKARKLGLDEWDYDDIYKCKKTGIIADIKIGNAPDPEHVLAHYGESVYNEYIKSPYCYNGTNIGIHYSKAWVPIADSQFKASSRGESLIGFINIISGIDTVQTKDNIVRPSSGEIEIFEEELEKEVFKPNGFRVRALKGNIKISEKQMESDILELLRNSAIVRNVMGFKDSNHFDKKNIYVNGGVPDISCYKDSSEKEYAAIIEMKKEGGDRLWKAIVQGFAYCDGTKSKRLIIIGQDNELKSEMISKIKPISRAMDITVDYYQYNYLISLDR